MLDLILYVNGIPQQLRDESTTFAMTIDDLIANDEDAAAEFKSTARWDLREDARSKAIEDAVVKTVAGLPNTDGGTLLIGVDPGRRSGATRAQRPGLLTRFTTHRPGHDDRRPRPLRRHQGRPLRQRTLPMTEREAMMERETRAEARREAVPAALVALFVLVGMAIISRTREWELVGLPWWIWLLLAIPSLLLASDLVLTFSGAGIVRSRRAALALLGLLVAGNVAALALLVTGLVTASTATLSGGELLLTGFAIWTTNVIVFGLLFWELEAGGPVARILVPERRTPDFQFPQDENPHLAPGGWHPLLWDYLYLSLTNSIAFSPTDTMPLSMRAKAAMAMESVISAGTILLVAARAVNVLGG